MTSLEVQRPDLESRLLARARSGPPLLLAGPPGSGKTSLLLRTAARLEAAGAVPVYLDLLGAASSPDRFVAALMGALPAAAFGRLLPRATEVRRIADAGRTHAAEAVEGALSLLAALDDGGRVVLLLDEITEIRSLAYFAGLRQVDRVLGRALARRPRGTLLATSFPTLAGRFWDFERLAAGPLALAELQPALTAAGCGWDAAALLRASAGWVRYAQILVASARAGESLEAVWSREMLLGGRLEAACRATYESLLLRSRGYGMSKAALAAVAQEEGLNLKALVDRLGRTPGAVRDYLHWLIAVDALFMTRKRYFYVDGVLRHWVRLHTRGTPPSASQVEAAARLALAEDAAHVA